jgi:hypothetical protein
MSSLSYSIPIVTSNVYAKTGTILIMVCSSLACLYYPRSLANNLFLNFDPTVHVLLSHMGKSQTKLYLTFTAETLLCLSGILFALLNNPTLMRIRICSGTFLLYAAAALYVWVYDPAPWLLGLIAACISASYMILINERQAKIEETSQPIVSPNINTNAVSVVIIANLFDISSALALLIYPGGAVNAFQNVGRPVTQGEAVIARALGSLMLAKSALECLLAVSDRNAVVLSGVLQIVSASLSGYYALIEKNINVGLFVITIFARACLGIYLTTIDEEKPSILKKPTVIDESLDDFLKYKSIA